MVADVARTVVDPDKVFTKSRPKMGSEDFADMLQAVPGAYFWLGHDGSVPVHNPGFVLDDKILPIGASMFARIIETPLLDRVTACRMHQTGSQSRTRGRHRPLHRSSTTPHRS